MPHQTPGPGSYETGANIISKEFTRKLMFNQASKNALSTSPSLHAASLTTAGTGSALRSNPQLQFGKTKNFAIPAIPSRFLTPILKFDMNEKDEQTLAG